MKDIQSRTFKYIEQKYINQVIHFMISILLAISLSSVVLGVIHYIPGLGITLFIFSLLLLVRFRIKLESKKTKRQAEYIKYTVKRYTEGIKHHHDEKERLITEKGRLRRELLSITKPST